MNQQLSDTAKYYNSRPKKAVGAGVLFFNTKGEVLIVKPTYLDRWLWVGGGVEEGETPLTAAIRECHEEIGVTPKSLRFAFVQYRPSKPDGQHDSLQFVFVANDVHDDFIDAIALDYDELEDAKFVPVDTLFEFVSAQRAKAVIAFTKDRSERDGLYIENGAIPEVLEG